MAVAVPIEYGGVYTHAAPILHAPLVHAPIAHAPIIQAEPVVSTILFPTLLHLVLSRNQILKGG